MLKYQLRDRFVQARGAAVPLAPAVAASRSRRTRQDCRLFERYRRTGAQHDRDELVARLLPLAKRLAWRYRDRDEYDDLVQVASFALIKAIDRYDPGRGLAFSTYAVPTIVGELKRYLRDHCWTVRVPRELHDRALQVGRASRQLTARLGRSPTPAEIAEELSISVELVLEALQTASAQRPDRLDASTDPEDEHGRPGTAAIEETGYANAEASATLEPLLARLPPREQEILRLRYERDLTQAEIGSLTGISQVHVGRLLRTAIAELQQFATQRPMTSAQRGGP
jgi:RNA polymerase sigma-B factor